MKKSIYILPFIIGASCFIGSSIIGSTINSDGILVEPFYFLIPVGYIFLIIGAFMLGFKGLSNLYKKIREPSFKLSCYDLSSIVLFFSFKIILSILFFDKKYFAARSFLHIPLLYSE